jgi:hypothetical protein
VRRSLLLLGIAVVAVLASATLIKPTSGAAPTQLPAIADYLHQVVDASPAMTGSLGHEVERLDAATATPTCASLVPPLQQLRPALDEALRSSATTDRVVVDARTKLLSQLATYDDQVLAICAS